MVSTLYLKRHARFGAGEILKRLARTSAQPEVPKDGGLQKIDTVRS
jgi:hypothetical protein